MDGCACVGVQARRYLYAHAFKKNPNNSTQYLCVVSLSLAWLKTRVRGPYMLLLNVCEKQEHLVFPCLTIGKRS